MQACGDFVEGWEKKWGEGDETNLYGGISMTLGTFNKLLPSQKQP